jgi:hypothetical protein
MKACTRHTSFTPGPHHVHFARTVRSACAPLETPETPCSTAVKRCSAAHACHQQRPDIEVHQLSQPSVVCTRGSQQTSGRTARTLSLRLPVAFAVWPWGTPASVMSLRRLRRPLSTAASHAAGPSHHRRSPEDSLTCPLKQYRYAHADMGHLWDKRPGAWPARAVQGGHPTRHQPLTSRCAGKCHVGLAARL